MDRPFTLSEGVDSWNTIIFLYRSALKEVSTKVEILNDEFQQVHQYNPIEYIKSRIKSPESIVKKLKRYGYESSIDNMVDYINDIAGIRIVCSFTSDIYKLAEMIGKQNDLTVVSVKDYIKHPKESGYKKNVVVKKIGKKYYGFDRNGYKVKKGVYADLKGTPYYFNKNGVRVAKKSSQLKKASKYMENGVKLRKLLGKPSKTKSYSTCMTGISKDLKLTYANIYVSLGKKIGGGEMVYGIQSR